MKRILCISCPFFLLQMMASAQDANYWSSAYSAGGFFSPGAVIANNRDSGVLFYNPALSAYNKKNAISVSGSIYQMESASVKNGTGTGFTLKSREGSVIPQMVASTISLKTKKSISLNYAIIHSPVMNYRVSQRRDDRFNVLDDAYSPGPEYYVGQYTMQNEVNITSAMVSSGIKVSKKFAVGVSVEGQVRKQNYLVDYNSRAIINTGSDPLFSPISSVAEYYLVSNRNIGLQIKTGFAWELSGNHHLGLLIATPLINISGTATLLSDNIVNNLKSGALDLNLLANTRQDKLRSKWKMPFSTALGYTFEYIRGQIYFATEYFLKVKEYNVIQPRNSYFLRPDTANNALTSSLLKMKDARKAVMNFALGTSFYFNPLMTGFLSVRTDFNYSDKKMFSDEDGYQVNVSSWDNYHALLGVNFKRKKFNLRTGVLLSFGRSTDFMQPLSFDDPNESNILLGTVQPTTATHTSLGIMLAYIHNL